MLTRGYGPVKRVSFRMVKRNPSGAAVVERIGQEPQGLGARRVLIVADGDVRKAG